MEPFLLDRRIVQEDWRRPGGQVGQRNYVLQRLCGRLRMRFWPRPLGSIMSHRRTGRSKRTRGFLGVYKELVWQKQCKHNVHIIKTDGHGTIPYYNCEFDVLSSFFVWFYILFAAFLEKLVEASMGICLRLCGGSLYSNPT